MTKVMVKTWFSSYIGQSIQMYYSGRRSVPTIIVKLADGSHRIARVVDAIDLGPDPVPASVAPPVFVPAPVEEHGE